MGTLVAKRYPTPLFANQADHTYVECGRGGKAWACWGGKTGGVELRRTTGSTSRADRIAGARERAGIKCYLINGVCHQAANRILLPGGVTVRGARGYSISEALFGTYGRLLFWPCRAPFHRHDGVSGDIAECAPVPPSASRVSEALATSDLFDWIYIPGVLALYERAAGIRLAGRLALTSATPKSQATALAEMESFHVELFRHMASSRLGPRLEPALLRRLLLVRRETERQRAGAERDYSARRTSGAEFAERFNDLTLAFQNRMANALTSEQYESLFDLPPAETVILADPAIVKTALRG